MLLAAMPGATFVAMPFAPNSFRCSDVFIPTKPSSCPLRFASTTEAPRRDSEGDPGRGDAHARKQVTHAGDAGTGPTEGVEAVGHEEVDVLPAFGDFLEAPSPKNVERKRGRFSGGLSPPPAS